MLKLLWPHVTETAFCCWLQIPSIKVSTIQPPIFICIIRIPEFSLKVTHRWSSKNPRRIPQKHKRKISTYSCVSHHHGRCPLPAPPLPRTSCKTSVFHGQQMQRGTSKNRSEKRELIAPLPCFPGESTTSSSPVSPPLHHKIVNENAPSPGNRSRVGETHALNRDLCHTKPKC